MKRPFDRASEMALHRRILMRELGALMELCSLARTFLIYVVRHDLRTHEDWSHDGVTDALLTYWAKPTQYSARGSLLSYLVTAAKRHVLDRQRAERSRHEHERRTENSVAQELADSSLEVQWNLDEQQIRAAVNAALPDERDQRVWWLMVEGEESLAEWATTLQLGPGLTDAELSRQKKLYRDRVSIRIKRLRHWFERFR